MNPTFRNLILLTPVKVGPNHSMPSEDLDQEDQEAVHIVEGPFYDGQGPPIPYDHTHLPYPYLPSPQRQKTSTPIHSKSLTKPKRHHLRKDINTPFASSQNQIETQHHVSNLNQPSFTTTTP